MDLALPSAGLHYGVPFEQYQKWDAINFSRLKPIRDTASKCRWAMDHPKKQTTAMTLGSALHIATLEPARFEQLFFICPPCDRRTTEGKEAFAKAEREANGKLIIRQGAKEDEAAMGEVERIRGMASAIRNSKASAPFIFGTGQNEVSMVWKDSETGLMCKGRIDRLAPEFELFDGIPVIVEIKSARDASEWGFGRDVNGYGYAAQASNYRIGYKSITGKLPMHVFIVVENEAPFDLAIYTLDDQSLQTGELQYRQMLKRYAECLRTGKWPGYPDKLQTLSLPAWAHKENYDK